MEGMPFKNSSIYLVIFCKKKGASPPFSFVAVRVRVLIPRLPGSYWRTALWQPA